MPLPQRILAIAGPRENETGWAANLFWFRLFVLLHMAGRSFLSIRVPEYDTWPHQLLLHALVVVGLAGLVPRLSLWASRLAALLVVAQIAITMPFTANHVFLELLCLGLLALLDESKQDEDELLLVAIRWLSAVFFFYTGLQKVLWGRYFDGQLLGYLTATEDRFAWFFQHFIPTVEFERLRAIGPPRAGAGPYRVDSLLFLAVSNSVYVFEMLAGVLLLVARTRWMAAIAAIGFVIMVELGAREIIFGALMINLLLLFVPGQWNKKLFGAFVVFYLYLCLANRMAAVPIFSYSL